MQSSGFPDGLFASFAGSAQTLPNGVIIKEGMNFNGTIDLLGYVRTLSPLVYAFCISTRVGGELRLLFAGTGFRHTSRLCRLSPSPSTLSSRRSSSRVARLRSQSR
jgi:hypothetical protein